MHVAPGGRVLLTHFPGYSNIGDVPASAATATVEPPPCRAKKKAEMPTTEDSSRAQGVSSSQKDLTQCGGGKLPLRDSESP